MRLTITTMFVAALLLVVIFELLRRQRLREKYAALWLFIGIVIVPLAAAPRVLDPIAERLGIVSGVSLVLFLAILFLLILCMHLSLELSQLEEETRTLAEEIALLRLELRAPSSPGVTATPADAREPDDGSTGGDA